jgi:polar amino acid transport system substrate-binding protein
MRMRSLLASLGLAAGLLASTLTGTAQADALARIEQEKVLRVAVPENFPPFGTVGPSMQPVGYDIDTANLIGKALGAKVELVPVASANRIPYLTTGKVDLVISSLGKNAEREKVIDFTVAYAPFFNGVFGPADIDVSKPEDLAGKVVAVTRGSVEDLELTKVAPATTDIKRYEDNNGTIQAFLSGQTDLVATGNVVAAAILEKNPPRKPVMKFLIKNSPCYVGVNKGEEALTEKVNAIITAAKADGSLEQIAQTWLKASLPADL